METRRHSLKILYNAKDITKDISPYLVSWNYNDNLTGTIDDFSLVLADMDGRWSGEWFPDQGAYIHAGIELSNWKREGDNRKFTFGELQIDDIHLDLPSTVSIRAKSLPVLTPASRERRTRAWEKTELKTIAGDIASRSGLKLSYDVPEPVQYERIEQTEESDIAFLYNRCTEAGLCLKVHNKTIQIFEEQKLEKQKSMGVIDRLQTPVGGSSLTASLSSSYSACTVQYTDHKKKQTVKHTFKDPKALKDFKRELVINQQVKDKAEAERLAKKSLREANKSQWQASVTLPAGNPDAIAGACYDLKNFGKFDGKYIIMRASHSGGNGGYKTVLTLRKCMEGY